jgi:hypothetical protein
MIAAGYDTNYGGSMTSMEKVKCFKPDCERIGHSVFSLTAMTGYLRSKDMSANREDA